MVWDCVERAIRAYNDGVELIPADEVISCINESNVDKAKALIEKYNLLTY